MHFWEITGIKCFVQNQILDFGPETFLDWTMHKLALVYSNLVRSKNPSRSRISKNSVVTKRMIQLQPYFSAYSSTRNVWCSGHERNSVNDASLRVRGACYCITVFHKFIYRCSWASSKCKIWNSVVIHPASKCCTVNFLMQLNCMHMLLWAPLHSWPSTKRKRI